MQTDIQIQIIRVTPDTASCLGRVADDVFDAEPVPAFVDAYLRAAHHALFVAIVDGVVVGQARGIVHLQPDLPTELYIDNLGVTPTLKRRGVATRLVAALTGWGKDAGARSVWLATETDNEEARGFYDAFGFAGATMAYYVDERASA